ncbi:MAG: polysaccharide deacetylase family protein [Anaerolineae bacterium]
MPAGLPAAPSTVERLGFSADTRVIILHADDLGMCLAENLATLDHAASGFAACGAVMAPCPWVPQMAHAAREVPGLDLGAHLTLNAEWRDYRWTPLTGRNPASGLVDTAGYQWSSVPDLFAHLDPRSAALELRAQVNYLLEQGIDLTHIDTHMGCVLHPALLETYIDLAFEFRLPVMLPRTIPAEYTGKVTPDDPLMLAVRRAIRRLDDAGWPVVDHIRSCGQPSGSRLDSYLELVDALPPGLTHLLYHAAVPDRDIEHIDRAHWPLRVADYRLMLDPAFRQALAARPNVRILGYRALNAILPA